MIRDAPPNAIWNQPSAASILKTELHLPISSYAEFCPTSATEQIPPSPLSRDALCDNREKRKTREMVWPRNGAHWTFASFDCFAVNRSSLSICFA